MLHASRARLNHRLCAVTIRMSFWQLLRSQSEGTYVQYECDFRGGETQSEVELRTSSEGIHMAWLEYACPRKRNKVVSRTEN